MRADRLVATLLLMQARGRVTAAELAEELEVSVATARRDLEALSAAGIPVYPQPGRGGGWSLVGGARTDLSGLTAAEAQALFLLAGPAAAVAPEVKSALRKLVRALPDTFRADAEAAAEAVVIDPSRLGRARPRAPELVGELQTAVVRRRKVRLQYAKGRRAHASGWSIRGAWSTRTTSGTSSPAPTTASEPSGSTGSSRPTSPTSPPNARRTSTWPGRGRQVVDEVEQRRRGLSATVLIETRFVRVLHTQFGRHCEESASDDGRARVRVAPRHR